MITADTARTLLEGFRPRPEIIAFGAALEREHGELDWPYFLEKPWKWSDEYTAWVNAGRPEEGWSTPPDDDEPDTGPVLFDQATALTRAEFQPDMRAAATAELAARVGFDLTDLRGNTSTLPCGCTVSREPDGWVIDTPSYECGHGHISGDLLRNAA